MKAKNPKFEMYTFAAIFVVLSLLLIVFLVHPALQGIKRGSGEIISEKSTVLFVEMENKELDRFKNRYESYESNLQKIDQLFVDTKNPVAFITFLENTAANTNVDAEISLVPRQNPQKDALPLLILQVSAKGTFRNILTFSQKLETGPYLVTINNLAIKKVPGGEEAEDIGALLDADIILEVIGT